MAGIDNSLTLGPGNISFEKELGMYYQDISPAIVHITNGVFANIDEKGIPYYIYEGKPKYYVVITIQYGLMCYDLLQLGIDVNNNTAKIKKCVDWLESQKEEFRNSIVWRSDYNVQYGVKAGWVSGMYQGQAISFYLRAYQLLKDNAYLKSAEKIFNSFSIDFEDGGFKRIDENNCIWFEEYPTDKPSYVLNGFIYAMFGILDLYRVTQRKDAKDLWDSCVQTLIINMPKYDVWYWSVYDQLKQQLASFYYQKNVHIPLMQIMFGLTNEMIFEKYAIKWQRNLNNPIHNLITKIMYRVKPRLKKLNK